MNWKEVVSLRRLDVLVFGISLLESKGCRQDRLAHLHDEGFYVG